jgi:PAS domain S-box-containing protein
VRASEGRFRGLLDGMADVVAIFDEERLLYLNPAGRAYLGMPPDVDPAGMATMSFMPPDEQERVRAVMRQVMATRRPAPLETFRHLFPDGRIGLVETSFSYVELDGGAALMAVIRDVAEQKQLEQKLMQADLLATLGSMTAGIAHEINNPLAFVTMNLASLRRRLDDLGDAVSPAQGQMVAELSRLAEESVEGVERVIGLVRELKLFARPGDEREPIDVRVVLEAALKLVTNELRYRARLVRDYGELPVIWGQAARLGQLLLNLLLHVARGLPETNSEHNQVWVIARGVEGGLEITLRDNVPHPPTLSVRAFDVLAMCQGIASAMGGRVTQGTVPGGGASLVLFLPVGEAAAARPRDPTPPQGLHLRPRLLIVDDEPALLRALSHELERDHLVTTATSGRAALALLSRAAFDVILCDLMMPEMTGMDLYAELRRAGEGVEERMVFMTGGAFTAAARGFLEATSNPCVEKPFRMESLRHMLSRQRARVLGRPGRQPHKRL